MALVPIYLASRGLTGEKDPTRTRTGDLLRAENVDFWKGNLLSKDGGAVKVNAVALGGGTRVVGGFDWWPTSGVQRRVVAMANGTLLRDDMSGAFATTLKSGLTIGASVSMSEGGRESAGANRKLFTCTGRDPVQVLSGDGLTTTNLATPPADWTGINQPSGMFLFRGFNGGFGNDNRPDFVYFSTGASHEDFTGAGSFQLNVYPGVGERIVAGITALGRGWIWKYPTGVFWINDSDTAITNWYIQQASTEYGAARTPNGIAQVDAGTIAFITHTGAVVFMQESSGTLSGVTFVDLFKALNLSSLVTDELEASRLDRSQMAWDNDKKQLHVSYAAKGAVQQNRRMVIDFNSERTRVEISSKETCESLWMEKDGQLIPRLVAGDNLGFVRKLNQDARLVDGLPYTLTVITTPTDFTDLDPGYMVLKNFYRLHLEYEATGNYDVQVGVVIDGRSRGTVPFNQSGGGGAILPFFLPATLGGTEMHRRSRAISGQGYNLSLQITEATENNPRIARAWAEFDPLTPQR